MEYVSHDRSSVETINDAYPDTAISRQGLMQRVYEALTF
jgi:hypothetical protein